jgi:hypothetical protein
MPNVGLHGSNQQVPNTPVMDRSNISSSLPRTLPPGFIPLNKDMHRLDTYIRPPTEKEWAIYHARVQNQKLCTHLSNESMYIIPTLTMYPVSTGNSFHLQGVCNSFCPFDHRELEPESRYVLEYVLKCSTCPQKGTCRKSDCIYGHLCQQDGCQGQMKGCRMKAELHAIDPKLASIVPCGAR